MEALCAQNMAADWACASCTLLNSRETSACDACGAAAGAQQEDHSEHGYTDEMDEDEDELDDLAFAEVDESPPRVVPRELTESFRRIQLAQDEDAAAAEQELLEIFQEQLAERAWKQAREHQEQLVKNAAHRRTAWRPGLVDVGGLHAHVSARLQITDCGPSVEAAEGLQSLGLRDANAWALAAFRTRWPEVKAISEAQWAYVVNVVQLFTAFVHLSYSNVPLRVGSDR